MAAGDLNAGSSSLGQQEQPQLRSVCPAAMAPSSLQHHHIQQQQHRPAVITGKGAVESCCCCDFFWRFNQQSFPCLPTLALLTKCHLVNYVQNGILIVVLLLHIGRYFTYWQVLQVPSEQCLGAVLFPAPVDAIFFNFFELVTKCLK